MRELLLGQHLLHLGGIGHVEGHEAHVGVQACQLVGAARGGHQFHAGLLVQQGHELLAQQAIGTSHENFHCITTLEPDEVVTCLSPPGPGRGY